MCGVLSFCLSATVAEDDSKEGVECLGQYLKSKGKIESHISESKQGSQCAEYLPLAMNTLRNKLETKLRTEFPNETPCLMTEFDNSGIIDNILLKVYNDELKAAKGQDGATENDTSKSSDEDGNNVNIATKCMVDQEKFEKIFATVFTTSSEETS